MKLSLYSQFIGIVLLGCSLASLSGMQERDYEVLHEASIGSNDHRKIKEARFYTDGFKKLLAEARQGWRGSVDALSNILKKTTPKNSRKEELVSALTSYRPVLKNLQEKLEGLNVDVKVTNNLIDHTLSVDSPAAAVKEKLVQVKKSNNQIMKWIDAVKKYITYIFLQSGSIIRGADRQSLDAIRARILNSLVNEQTMVKKLMGQGPAPQLAEIADEQWDDSSSDYDSSDDESDDDEPSTGAVSMANIGDEQSDDSSSDYDSSDDESDADEPSSGAAPDASTFISVFDAVESGNLGRVTELLGAGANPNEAHATGIRPLHAAVALGYNDIVKALLRAGANPNAVDTKTGNTPLHVAVKLQNHAAAKDLIGAGALATIKNNRGKDALQMADEEAYDDSDSDSESDDE